MVEVFFKNPACGNRIESVIGSYADYSLDETELFIHDVDVTKEVIIVPAKSVVKIEYIE